MKTIRQQAKIMGHEIVGSLKRGKDDVYRMNDEDITNRIYIDSEGTVYAINWKGELLYIAGEDWVL